MIKKNKNFFILIGSLLFLVLFTCLYSQVQAEFLNNKVNNQEAVVVKTNSSSSKINNPDAIAVRIIPNPNHYSINRWYTNQGFQGSPQSLMVDGYEAIRDGRTVYVNAANIDDYKNIYTNIYLISYNQNPSPDTVDILGQIVSHWKFNDNLNQFYSQIPTCSISTLSCASNSDCPTDQFCASSEIASSTCLFKSSVNCLRDGDCPVNFFCDSLKAKIIRDVKRAGELQELKIALANFKEANNYYPKLAAGTYLPGNSISLWPSWSQVLLSDLAAPPSLIDPINHLGACPSYDQATCWDQTNKKFFSPLGTSTLVLPPGSYALAYATNNNGSKYDLCASIETRALDFHFFPNDFNNSACVLATGVNTGGVSENHSPELESVMLSGETGQEFNAYIRVNDPDNDPLTWSLESAPGSAWTGWLSNGYMNQCPILKDTTSPNQKKVYAEKAGLPGTYNIILNVDDGREGILSTTSSITIFSSPITIIAENGEYSLNSSSPFQYTFYFSGNGLEDLPTYSETVAANSYYLSKIDGPSFDLLGQMAKNIVNLGNHRYRVTFGINKIPPDPQFTNGAEFHYRIRVTDKNNNSASKDFLLKLTPSSFVINIECPTEVRINNNYNCHLGPATQNNANLYYSASGLPAGISSQGQDLNGSPIQSGVFPVSITITNDYGVSQTESFNLKVSTYCGDGIKESPNMEETGGINNNGLELCDGNSGITTDVSASNINLQYACTTLPGAQTNNPIMTNDQCIFASPNDGGGYCGDEICETLSSSGKDLETCSNCSQDCGTCCIPDYSNKCAGADDGCGGEVPDNGYNNVCLANFSQTCNDYFNQAEGWIGNVTCSTGCTGFDISDCQPDSCLGSSTYWYKALNDDPYDPVTNPYGLSDGDECMIRMQTDSSGAPACTNNSVSSDNGDCNAVQVRDYVYPYNPIPNATWAWFKGIIHFPGYTCEEGNLQNSACKGPYYSLSETGPFSCVGVKNPMKCRWVTNCHWTNQCYVHN